MPCIALINNHFPGCSDFPGWLVQPSLFPQFRMLFSSFSAVKLSSCSTSGCIMVLLQGPSWQGPVRLNIGIQGKAPSNVLFWLRGYIHQPQLGLHSTVNWGGGDHILLCSQWPFVMTWLTTRTSQWHSSWSLRSLTLLVSEGKVLATFPFFFFFCCCEFASLGQVPRSRQNTNMKGTCNIPNPGWQQSVHRRQVYWVQKQCECCI